MYVFHLFFPSGAIRRVQFCERARGHQTRRPGSSQTPETQEAARPFFAGPGVRAGAPLQAAEIPVRPGERPPGRRAQTHPDPGEDLVPEQEVQVQAAEAGPEPGDGVGAAAQEGVGAGAGAGWEALSGGGCSHLQPLVQHGSHQPFLL